MTIRFFGLIISVEFINKENDWKHCAKKGQIINSIRAYRAVMNKNITSPNDPRYVGLKLAKDTVENYMKKIGVDWHGVDQN